MDYIEEMTNANRIILAMRRVERASGWKDSAQKILVNRLKFAYEIRKEVREGTYHQGEGATFQLCENGHTRLVKALCTKDLIVQHSLTDTVLFPHLLKYLIHDNGASIRGKGISFTRRRFEQHIRKFYREHGKEGYIMLIDFRKFFDNIRHDRLDEKFHEKLLDDRLRKFMRRLFENYRVDVSYSDNENIIDEVFNSLEYQKIDHSLLTGRRYMAKSLGIGAPISQIAGIFFPTAIDTYCKTVKHCKFYGVYMDDRYVIHHDKAFMKELLEDICRIASELGLHVNRRKTQIVKISHGFTFLKTRYILSGTGKLIKKIPRDVVVRQRRKMKKLASFVARGEMTLEDFKSQYQSWRGDKRKYNAFHTLQSMDKLYWRLLKWIKRPIPSSSRAPARPSPLKA